MRKILTVLTILFLTASVFAETPEGAVRVYVNQNSDQRPDVYGSGVLISPTQILTARHVVQGHRRDRRDNNRAVQVRFPDGSRRYAAVSKWNSTWDVALLTIHPTALKPFTVGNRPVPGDMVTIQGFGSDYEYRAVTGPMSNKKLHPSNRPDQTDYIDVLKTRARKGDSGGPITDEHGHLIGILFGAGSTNTVTYTRGTLIDRIQKVFGSAMQPSQTAPEITDEPDYILQKEDPNNAD